MDEWIERWMDKRWMDETIDGWTQNKVKQPKHSIFPSLSTSGNKSDSELFQVLWESWKSFQQKVSLGLWKAAGLHIIEQHHYNNHWCNNNNIKNHLIGC